MPYCMQCIHTTHKLINSDPLAIVVNGKVFVVCIYSMYIGDDITNVYYYGELNDER